jgi:curved DNA-binding protein CbpA
MEHYINLNLLPTATMEEINNSYKSLFSEDLSDDEKIKLNKAFTVLSDYSSRKKYDNLMEEINNVTPFVKEDLFQNLNETNEEPNYEKYLSNDENKIINHLDKLFINLNERLENIEKLLYNKEINNNNYYKERKKIHTSFSNGKKIVNIITDINNNGEKKKQEKTISYDKDGNQNIHYKNYNLNHK